MVAPAGLSRADEMAAGGGPFPNRNYNPVQLLFLSFPAEKATTLSRGSYRVNFEFSESNTLLVETTSRVDAFLKFETFRAAWRIAYGLTPRSEVGLEIPMYHRNGGLLDPFIMNMEDAFKHLSLERNRYAERSFGGYTIRRDGETILSGEDHQYGLGDMVLSGKTRIFEEGPGFPAVTLRGAVKFPTGNFDKAFGSGRPDLGIGLVLEKQPFSRWIFYFNQSVVAPGGHFGRAELILVPIYSAALTAEFMVTRSFSIVGQADAYSTPFRGTGASLLDHGVTEAVLGVNYRTRSRTLWQLFGIENFVEPVGAAADFTLGTQIAAEF